jgi:uncharacterized protein (TIRG00374 family)
MFAVAFGIGLSSLLVCACVWHRFFGQMAISSTRSLTVRMFLTGHFLNSITPLGQFGGEPIMAYIVSDNTGTEYERALACVISADIVNAVPFFTFTLGGLVYLSVVGSLNSLLIQVGALSVLLLVVGGVLAYLLWSENSTLGETATGILHGLETRLTWGESLFQALRDRVTTIESAFEEAGNDPVFLLKTAAISHLAILAQIVSLYFVFVALDIEAGFVPLYFIVNLSVIATISPTPGGSGTYEAAFSALVTFFFPVSLATALTAAVLFRLTTYWPGILVGYPSLLTLRNGPSEKD